MDSISGAVYDPPHEGLPTLAVVFGVDGDILVARGMDSRAEAEALLAQIHSRIQAQVDAALGDEAA